MAYKRRYTKKKAETTGKLMVAMKNRDRYWIPCDAAQGEKLCTAFALQVCGLASGPASIFDFRPMFPLVVVLGDISAVQYFPPKTATPEKDSE